MYMQNLLIHSLKLFIIYRNECINLCFEEENFQLNKDQESVSTSSSKRVKH